MDWAGLATALTALAAVIAAIGTVINGRQTKGVSKKTDVLVEQTNGTTNRLIDENSKLHAENVTLKTK